MKMQRKVAKVSLLVIALMISITIPILVVTAKKKEWVLDAPIIIDELIDGLTWADRTAEPWCKGAGTEEEPYIIKNVVIDSKNFPFCMMIRNSEAFFKIMDCTFYNTETQVEDRNAGLVLLNTQNGVIFKNKFFGIGFIGLGQGAGIALIASHFNTIQKNLCFENEGVGIYLEWSSNNDITKNDCTDNSGTGIVIGSSHGNFVTKNYCTKNGEAGITVIDLYGQTPENNIIYGNKVANNPVGIYISEGDNNDVFRNTIKENNYGMIVEGQSEFNHIYHNNFINNMVQASNIHAGLNNWHNIYMLEGNYWSDYTGTDNDGDGIGDTQWPEEEGFDVYPFMEKDGWEYLTPIEEEILNAKFDPDANKLGFGREFRSDEKGYLILGVMQLFSERRQRLAFPPYTIQAVFGENVIILSDSVWYFDEEGQMFGEPGLVQFFYLVIPPNYFTVFKGLPLGYYEFQLEFTWYDNGEKIYLSFTTSFYLV